jgi:hypothetical protein
MWDEDILRRARSTILEIMDSKSAPRNSIAKLAAAKLVLSENFLAQLPDEALLAEVARRAKQRTKCVPSPSVTAEDPQDFPTPGEDEL